ncbi:MAG: AAA family ATPase [Thiotrichales bacterium]|nr:AAA family ATPase [Thiotrichales bacterium]
MNTEQLIDLLCQPQSYPHPVEVITTIETHISVVFLTGQYAYKLKKPVDFGFLNFTRLEDRERFCLQELRLNRRTAPDLYIDVVPIYLDAQGNIHFTATNSPQPAENPVDFLVKMNQFEPSWVLGRYLENHHLSSQQEQLLAQRIADLHLNANMVKADSHLGEPETILQPMLDNFPTLFSNCTEDYTPRLQALLDWTNQQFSELRPLLVSRKKEGYVRECHGDLHLDNITLINEVPTLFDGIEFNDEFRWIDGISDLAFLLIDLDFRQQSGFKRRLFSQYMALTGDYAAIRLLSFYRVYRSLVRAKISALRLTQLDKNSLEFQHYKTITLQYIHQAERDAFNKFQPQIILLQGVSGSGKSHFANQLLTQIEALVISSDIERKKRYGIKPTHRVSEQEKQTLYSPKMNQQTYQRLQDLTKQIIGLGMSVIVDATFLKAQHRLAFYDLANTLNCQCKTIYIETDETTAKQSIQQRIKQNDNPSDADISVMLKQMKVIEAPSENEHSLTLKASELRRFYPTDLIQDFLF